MSNIIKNFSDFHTPSKVNEGAVDFITGLLSSAGTALTDVVKNKIISYLYDFLGVPEGSFVGNIIEKVGQQIDFSEYGDLIMGDGIPASKLAPKFADATFELFAAEGIRPLAKKFMGEDFNTNGLLYRTLEEMITNQAKQEEFKKSLVSFWTWVFTGGGSSPQASLFQPMSKDKQGNVKSGFTFTPAEQKKIASDPAVKNATKSGALSVQDILSSLTGGAAGEGSRAMASGA